MRNTPDEEKWELQRRTSIKRASRIFPIFQIQCPKKWQMLPTQGPDNPGLLNLLIRLMKCRGFRLAEKAYLLHDETNDSRVDTLWCADAQGTRFHVDATTQGRALIGRGGKLLFASLWHTG